MKTPSKKSSILSATIWALGFVMAFKIPPGNKCIWLPDSLLLTGFFPILISADSAWLWLIFGILNIVIAGAMLLIISAPADELARLQATEMIAHIKDYHPCYVWAIVGIFSTIIGAGRLTVRFCLFLYKRATKSNL